MSLQFIQDTTLPSGFSISFRERFWNRVNKTDTCWLWTGMTRKDGYGHIRAGKSSRGNVDVHRASWILHNGNIPRGMHVCHTCDVRSCIRPDHLFLGTALDNIRDAKSKKRNAFGERSGHAVLSESAVENIRRTYAMGFMTQKLLARIFGVCRTNIGHIVRGKSWKHSYISQTRFVCD